MIDNDDKNPLDAHKCVSIETVLTNKLYDDEYISIAPGEDSPPVPLAMTSSVKS